MQITQRPHLRILPDNGFRSISNRHLDTEAVGTTSGVQLPGFLGESRQRHADDFRHVRAVVRVAAIPARGARRTGGPGRHGAAAAVDYLLFNVPNCRKSRQCVGTAPPHRSWNDTNRSGPFHARIHRCPVKLCHHRRIAIMPAHAGDHQRDCETLISFSVLSSQSVVSGVWTYDWDSIRTYRGFGEKFAERARLRGSDILTPSSSPARGSC
jgi:hypothetical protein